MPCRRFLPVALLASGALSAHAEAISTDRPDFVESSAVVGKGRFQIETSVAGEHDRADSVRSHTLATPTLLRLGISDNLELRLETDGAQRTRLTDDASGIAARDQGWADVSLGVKWHWGDGDEAAGRPAMAWLLHADLDTGSAPYRGRGVRPSLRLVAEWELADEWSLGVMPGVYLGRNDTERRYVGAIAAIVAAKGWTERLRSFFELAGRRIARGRDGGSVFTFDTGIAYLVTDNVQLDGAIYAGLNRNAPDLGWTLGLSVKF